MHRARAISRTRCGGSMRGSALPVSRDRAAGAWESTDVVYETHSAARTRCSARTHSGRGAPRGRHGAGRLGRGRRGLVQDGPGIFSVGCSVGLSQIFDGIILIGFFVCRGLPGRSFCFLC
jgi:hypothetical protein